MTSITQQCHAWQRLGAALLLICVLAAPAGAKQTIITPPPTPEVLTLDEAARLLRVPASELERLAQRNEVPARRVAKEWRFNRQALLAWVNGDWKLIATAVPPSARPLTPQAMKQITALGTTTAQGQTAPPGGGQTPTTGASDESKPIGEAPEGRTAEETFLRGRKVLLAPGEVAIDTGLFYSAIEGQQLALVNGGIGLATGEQHTFTTLIQGRVGVADETELFASTTFFDQDNDVYLGSRKIAEFGRSEFGDVRLGIRRTLVKEGPGRPDIIATLDGRIPTGETSYAVGGGLAFVKSLDPVVLFASTNYRHTFSRDFADVTRLEPEERIDASVGYALALNDTLTLSTTLSGVFTGGTNFSAAELRPEESFSLQFALTAWLAKGLYIEPSVSFELGDPTNSFVLGVTVPYTF